MKTIKVKLYGGEVEHETRILAEKNGLVVHKTIIDLGGFGERKPTEIKNSYTVSLLKSTCKVLSTKLLRDAKEYLEQLAALADWNQWEDPRNVPTDIVEAAWRIKRQSQGHVA